MYAQIMIFMLSHSHGANMTTHATAEDEQAGKHERERVSRRARSRDSA